MKISITDKRNINIILPRNPSPCLQYAAKELADFAKKCMNIEWHIVTDDELVDGAFISLGDTKQARDIGYQPDITLLNDDGFYIKTIGDSVYIKAESDRGILFGVYEIAERYLGVRFICSDTTVFPVCTELNIEDGEICEIPAFRLRGYLEHDLYEDTGTMPNQADKVFALRQRARHSFLFPSEKFGGGSKIWGRHNTHNFHYFVDVEKYGNPKDKENYHPEFFFSAKDGENDNFQFVVAGNNDTTICLTNGITEDGEIDEAMNISVAKVVIEEMKKDLIEHPNIDYFAFEQEDGNICCQCERCKAVAAKYKRSGLLMRFVNAVGKSLQKWSNEELNGRKIRLVTYAYAYTLDAPVVELNGEIKPIDSTVIPNENVVIRMAVGADGFYHYFDERQEDQTRKALKEWGALGGQFFVWTYDMFFDRYLLYMPTIHTIQDNVKGFKSFGCEYLMVQGAYNAKGIWQCKLRAYLYQKAMWNPNVDIEVLTDEFLTHYFGVQAVPYMRQFIQVYHDFYQSLSEKKAVCYTYGMRNKEDYDKDVLLKTLDLVRMAKRENKEKAQDEAMKEIYDRRLSQAEVNSLFPLVENYFYYFPDKTQEEYLAYAKDFLSLCRYADISLYAEVLKLADWEACDYKFPY